MARFVLSSLLAALLLVPARAADEPKAAADLVLLNGKIWTVHRAKPEAEALAVSRDRLGVVGSNADVKPLIGPSTRVIDLKGRRVVPGFYDSHVHLLGSGLRLTEVALKDAKDEAEFGRRLREFDR